MFFDGQQYNPLTLPACTHIVSNTSWSCLHCYASDLSGHLREEDKSSSLTPEEILCENLSYGAFEPFCYRSFFLLTPWPCRCLSLLWSYWPIAACRAHLPICLQYPCNSSISRPQVLECIVWIQVPPHAAICVFNVEENKMCAFLVRKRSFAFTATRAA